ncbi:MAG: DUF45 domain-containing protein [Deltaproteobacteria bacterium]|nr:DUF45 domain-containing protein [Deltaproteobacteria bacterium]
MIKKKAAQKSIIREIRDVGPVLFERSLKARRLNVSIRPLRGIRVAVPVGISLKKAERFLYSKTGWIQKHMKRMEKAEQEHRSLLKSPEKINRSKARMVLVDRLNELASANGFEYGRVFVRSQKTLWGSCSGKNNISLNLNLLRLPDDLRDYVILHELVHTRIKNHSRTFWTELEKYVDEAKKKRFQLKRWGPIPPC